MENLLRVGVGEQGPSPFFGDQERLSGPLLLKPFRPLLQIVVCRCPFFCWRVGLEIGLLDEVLAEGATVRLPQDHFPWKDQLAGSMLAAMDMPIAPEERRAPLRRTMDLQ